MLAFCWHFKLFLLWKKQNFLHSSPSNLGLFFIDLFASYDKGSAAQEITSWGWTMKVTQWIPLSPTPWCERLTESHNNLHVCNFSFLPAVVTCERPPDVDHGSFSPFKNTYQYNEVVKYSCDAGYNMTGNDSRSCSQSGTFTSAPPTCTSKFFCVLATSLVFVQMNY